jgi:capsular exopolysaccharide synthesis family protein
VLLIDGNAYRPSLHQIFSVSNDTGLSNVLFHSSDLEDTVKDVGIRNLSVLTSGPFLSVSSNPLDSDLLASLLARARDQYDIVIIDSPALLSLTDTSVLAVQSDGVLLVIHSEITRRDKAVKAKKLLEQLNVPLIGCVLNHAKSGAKQDYYQYSATRAK